MLSNDIRTTVKFDGVADAGLRHAREEKQQGFACADQNGKWSPRLGVVASS